MVGQWENIEDALQMAILYFIHTFLYSQPDNTPIPIEDFYMVEDGSYQQFPWGIVAFEKLIKSFQKKVQILQKVVSIEWISICT